MNNIWKEMFSSQNNKKAQEQGGLFDSSIPQGVGSRKDAQVRLQKDLMENMVKIRAFSQNTSDLLDRQIEVSGVKVGILMCEGMINLQMFTQIMVRPLSEVSIPNADGEAVAHWVSKNTVFSGDQKEFFTYDELFTFLMAGFVPGLYKSLGLYIPLIVVNCIILGRAESYASKNPVLPSIFDGIGMGLGFTVGLTAIGIVRELLGAGEVFGIRVMPQSYEPLTIFVLAPGAFFVLACLVALQNKVKANLEKKGKKVPVSSGCGEGCSACASKGICGGHLAENEPHHEETNVKEEEEA